MYVMFVKMIWTETLLWRKINFQTFISFIVKIDGLLKYFLLSLMRHILVNLPLDFISTADKFAISYQLNFFYILYSNHVKVNLSYSSEITFGSCMSKMVTSCKPHDSISVNDHQRSRTLDK